MRKEKRSIHFMVLFCAAVLLCLSGATVEVQAAEIIDSGTCGSNLTWTLDDAGTLTISGTGDMVAPYGTPFCYFVRGSISSVVIEDGVTSIAESVFIDCVDLTSVTIPASVTSIGNSAFHGCSSLTSITIPERVTSIGESAFYGCNSLTSITIPESVTSIGESAISGCTSLTGIWVDANNTAYSSDNDGALFNKEKTQLIAVPGAVNGVYVIPDSVTSISVSAFRKCSSLTSIAIPDSVTSIGAGAFYDCSSLTSIAIPDGVTSIDSNTFNGCSSLTSIIIPDGVAVTYWYTFYGCSSLTSITIPEGVTSIGAGAFYGCSSLTNIAIPEGVTSIGDRTFYDCDGLTSITIPDSVTSIGDRTFYDCDGLTSIAIPDGITSIGDYTFYDCDGLTGITIPDSVTSIGYEAFLSCSSLTSVTIGDSVTSIDYYAFEYCRSLTEVFFLGNAPSFRNNVFYDVTATAYYPSGNDTWTEDVRQDYGGDITWVSYTLDTANPVDEWNLSLEDDLVIRFHLDADTLRFASLKLTVGDKTESFRLSEVEQTVDGQYIASMNIAAAQMNDSITVQAVCGQQESELSSYTVRQYCDTILADEGYSEYHAIIKEMLHYGAMAQLHFGYNAENLANTGITGTAAEDVPETAGEVAAVGKIDGVAFHGASLVYRDKIAVRYYFTGDVTGCSFTANGKAYTPVEKDGMHYVEIGDIPPQDLDQQITLTVTDTQGNGISVTYGPMNYIVRMNEKGSDTLKSLMKALYNYHLAAKTLRTSA